MRHSVLVISFSDFAADPRVARQVRWLADGWRVTTAGLGKPSVAGVEFVPVQLRRGSGMVAKIGRGLRFITRQFERLYWVMAQSAYQALRSRPHDLIIANDPDTFPLAWRLAQEWRAALVLDAHEYAPREFEDNWKWRVLHGPYASYLCRHYMPKAHATLTVCQGLAEAYGRFVGVTPTVITNAPDYHPELSPRPYTEGQPIRLVHHGVAVRARRMDAMIDVARLLDERFESSFVLVGDQEYQQELRQRAANHPQILFPSPVPMPELPSYLNQYDIGLAYFMPTNFSLRHALPNKFFEFIQARIAVAIGPSPEMVRIVNATGLGIVADDFDPATVARRLNQLTADDINRMKQAAHGVAEQYSASANHTLFLNICEQAMRANNQ